MTEYSQQQQISKTRLKQQMHQLQELGESLLELPKDKLEQLDLPEILRDAVLEACRITARGGKKRQLQYIGKLMRSVDPAPIQHKLDQWNNEHSRQTALLHQLEKWRQRLIEDDAALTRFLQLYSNFDAQPLRVLIRNARKEKQLNKPPKSSRELFCVLRDGITR